MKLARLLIPLLSLAVSAFAETQSFTILDGQKITAEMSGGLPLPAEKEGIKIEVAAFMIQEGKLIYSFGFSTQKEVTKVVVEEVSGSSALPMVTDSAPALSKAYWKGDAKPLPLTQAGVPWVFEEGDTVKVFRFTITTGSDAAPVILHQPAIYGGGVKVQLRQLAQ
ncbi:MAG: hypothetical protein V4672_16690 [Verrucomicrobiota bacterium]